MSPVRPPVHAARPFKVTAATRAMGQAATLLGASVRSMEAAQARMRRLEPALDTPRRCADLQRALGRLRQRNDMDLESYRHLMRAVMRRAASLDTARALA